MSVYELIDYDRLLERIGIPDGFNWRCGTYEAEFWEYNEAGLTYDDVYLDDPERLKKTGAAYDGKARGLPGNLCLANDINVNGLLLNHRDANGSVWVCTDIEGWWTLPPSEIADVPRPYWDGSMLTTGRYLTRTITISGCFMPANKSLVWYNRDLVLRAASIVRGVGLLAVCGNNATAIYPNDERFVDAFADAFYDPPKMCLIQTNDVPLVETTKPNGFTQFSLSFKCVYPVKQSVGERNQLIPFPEKSGVSFRRYESFGRTYAYGGETGGAGEPEGMGITAYQEVSYQRARDNPSRKYSDVLIYNSTNPIEDEDEDPQRFQFIRQLSLFNKGNYFAHPVYVFEHFTFNETWSDGVDTHPVTSDVRFMQIVNVETGEIMRVVKEIKEGEQLIVDTNARRVCLATRKEWDDPWKWQWNARDYLTLDSDWISLAPGKNMLEVSGPVTFYGNHPRAYWRDSWIG